MATEHDGMGIQRFVTFDSRSAVELFGRAQAWLAPRDGSLTVVAVHWNVYSEGDTFGMTLYYEPD